MGPHVEGGELLQIVQDVGRVAPPHAELAGRPAGAPGGVAVLLARRRQGCAGGQEDGENEGQRRPDEAPMAGHGAGCGARGAFPAVTRRWRGAATVGGQRARRQRHGLVEGAFMGPPARAKIMCSKKGRSEKSAQDVPVLKEGSSTARGSLTNLKPKARGAQYPQ